MSVLYKYIFDPFALEEYIEAIAWYEKKSEVASEQFIDHVEERLKLICSDPYRYRQMHKPFREISLSVFPY